MAAAFRMLIVTCVCSSAAKHIYFTCSRTWSEAQTWCRENFIDLSAITSKAESEAFKKAFEGKTGWIGLYKNRTSPTYYSWSGRGRVNYTDWVESSITRAQSDDFYYGFWNSNGWNLWFGTESEHYFCFNLIVIAEKKSWEEALEYCREEHTEITSLTSEHEVLAAQAKIQQDSITDPVWIGLRFLGNRWLWVNKDPLEYQAWAEGGGHNQCLEKKRCGAITKGGQWENRDCQERLSFICYYLGKNEEWRHSRICDKNT